MPNEALIIEMENILADVVQLGGANEQTSIVPNLTIQDSNPAGLTGFVIVSDDRDGDNILAKTVGSVVYSDNDLVNVIFVKGGEAIAFQQGSQSANSGIWEIVPSTSTDIFYDKGKVGIGTNTIPHGGVGVALLALEGVDFGGATGPHIQITTDADDYPLMQHYFDGHDEMSLNFDAFINAAGNDISSAVWNNFQIKKSNGDFEINYDTAVAAGGAVSWLEGITLNGTTGSVGVGTVSSAVKLESVSSALAQLRLTHTFGSKFVDFTVDTNHDLTITPTSTGQIILQPTTDSTDFFHVLDADGGEPVLQVNTVDETVSIATPDSTFVVGGTTTTTGLFIENPDAANYHGFTLRKISNTAGRGTALSVIRARVGPAAVASGDLLGALQFMGHDGTDYNRSSGIRASVLGAVSANTMPGRLEFQTTTSNALTTRMNIEPNGRVKIGAAGVPAARLHVDQSGSAGAIPVVLYDQADVDEPFVKYIGSAAAATLTRSIVAEADVTTATRQGFVKIEIEDVGNQVTDQDYFVPFYTLA